DGLSRGSRLAGALDTQREQVRRIAANSDHAWPGVRADDRSQRLDHQRVGDGLELARDALCIRLCVGVADDDANALALVQLPGQLDDAVERSLESANALERRHQAVANAQDGLDLQDGTEQSVGA